MTLTLTDLSNKGVFEETVQKQDCDIAAEQTSHTDSCCGHKKKKNNNMGHFQSRILILSNADKKKNKGQQSTNMKNKLGTILYETVYIHD